MLEAVLVEAGRSGADTSHDRPCLLPHIIGEVRTPVLAPPTITAVVGDTPALVVGCVEVAVGPLRLLMVVLRVVQLRGGDRDDRIAHVTRQRCTAAGRGAAAQHPRYPHLRHGLRPGLPVRSQPVGGLPGCYRRFGARAVAAILSGASHL